MKKLYGVFYRSNHRWTGPYQGEMFDESYIKQFAEKVRRETKSRVQIRELRWVPVSHVQRR